MPRGGPREGAGRKRGPTRERQEAFRDVLLGAVAREEWAAVVAKAVEQAKDGDGAARSWLGSYLMGAPPKEISGQVDADGRFLFVVE